METKQVLRHTMKNRLAAMPERIYKQKSTCIMDNLINVRQWKRAETIGIVISKDREVNTTPIIEEAWKQAKTIVVPKTFPAKRQMNFYEITSFRQLEETYFGLKEPKLEHSSLYEPAMIDLMIVPGLVFDRSGYRIGFGGGFYDRYLQNYNGVTCALAFDCQLVDDVPHEDHDVPVEMLVTNQAVYS